MTDLLPIEDLDSRAAKLIKWAQKAKKRAYAPYSHFTVGCCVLDARGKLHTGCNVENASYSVSVCAERVALSKMVTRGSRECRRIVVITSSEDPIFPCGICLQFITELGRKAIIYAVNVRGTVFRQANVAELLPSAFTRERLSK